MDEQQAAPSVIHDLEQVGHDAVAELKTVLGDSEKAIVAALGHAHNLLSALNPSAELQTAKSAVESAILNFAKHLGL